MQLPDLPAALVGLLAQIPRGMVTTYGALANALGSAAAARWVGHWMLHHEHKAECPCHRVVRSDGQVGRFIAGTMTKKADRLAAEGLKLHGDRVDIRATFFGDFQTSRPLAALRRKQQELAAEIKLRGRRTMPQMVAGIDVSYKGDQGFAAYALWSVRDSALIWSTTVRRTVRFPYIPGFLAFRELPILLDLIEAAGKSNWTADVAIVDGSGILHPRGAGIACHLGVLARMATIGVSKKLLSGTANLEAMEPGESRPVVIEDRPRGVALRPTAGSRRPIFISPGHRIGTAMAEVVVRNLLTGRRLPEPQYWADRLSRREARS